MAPVPPITPYLTVADAAGAVEFYKKALGATVDGEAHRMPGSDKIMHVRLIIATEDLIMLADDFSDRYGRPMHDACKAGRLAQSCWRCRWRMQGVSGTRQWRAARR